jgi:hypothetical protein
MADAVPRGIDFMPCFKRALVIMSLVRLVGLEPTTGKTPVDFKPTAYANFATAAPGVYAAPKEYHVRRNVEHDPRALGESAEFSSNCACLDRAPVVSVILNVM